VVTDYISTYVTQSDVNVLAKAQCVCAIKHRFCFREYELSFTDHILPRRPVFIWKILAICQTQTHMQLTDILLQILKCNWLFKLSKLAKKQVLRLFSLGQR